MTSMVKTEVLVNILAEKKFQTYSHPLALTHGSANRNRIVTLSRRFRTRYVHHINVNPIVNIKN